MKFMNLVKWRYSNPQEKADDGQQGGGGGAEPFKTFATQAELDAYVKSLSNPAPSPAPTPSPAPVSITDTRREQQEREQQEREKTAKIQMAVIFDNSFDDVIKKNSDLFPESSKTIRNDVKSDDVVERSNLIAATAAKEYFSIPKNLEQLTRSDRERVEKEILGVRYESQIDGFKAWELVERSLYGHELANRHKAANDFTGKGGNGSTGFKNVDNYLSGFFPKDVVSVPH
ncbi:MAG: hypothetical protein ACRCXG_16245 [Vibrio sp.]